MPIVSLDTFERKALEEAIRGGVSFTPDEQKEATRIIEAKYLTVERTRYVITADGRKALNAAKEFSA